VGIRSPTYPPRSMPLTGASIFFVRFLVTLVVLFVNCFLLKNDILIESVSSFDRNPTNIAADILSSLSQPGNPTISKMTKLLIMKVITLGG